VAPRVRRVPDHRAEHKHIVILHISNCLGFDL
jgi:hypothetical protein